MKTSVLAGVLLTTLMASSAYADTVLGVKAGGDYWQADANNSGEANFSSSSQGSVWVALEHPIPLIPNAMLRENRISGDRGATKTDLDNTDFTLYYEILDNDLVTLDLGGTYKKMHGDRKLNTYKHNIDNNIIMGYGSAMVGVPGLGLFGFADIQAGLNESKVYDVQGGLGWQFDGSIVDTRIRTGYREFNFDADSVNTKFSGFFAGVELDF